MKRGRIFCIALVILLALTVSLSACGEGTVTEAVGAGATETRTKTDTPSPTVQNIASTPTEYWYYSTADAINTMVAPFPQHCGMEDFYSTFNLISPDGNWLANYCSKFSEASLKVIEQNGEKIWIIPFSDLPAYSSDYPAACAIVPLHWTKDSQYIYFSQEECQGPDSGGPPNFGMYSGPLYRLNTQTGQWARMVNESRFSTYYSFAPTDRRLIYINNQLNLHPHSINILDLKTGEITTIELSQKYYGAGNVIWSSDSLSFAYVTGYIDENFENLSFSVYVYEIPDGRIQQVVSDSSALCAPHEWTDTNVLVLYCNDVGDFVDYLTQPDQILYYELQENRYITATPTP